jgi:hypothetical protein
LCEEKLAGKSGEKLYPAGNAAGQKKPGGNFIPGFHLYGKGH